MYTLENEFLNVSISEKGAELSSVYDKEMNKEVLWNGDKKYWGRHAPILFPNVGRHHENFYLYKGQRFHTVQHGFARDLDFICVEHTLESICFQLTDTSDTKSYFPFAFSLKITYQLTGRSLEILWEVENRDTETMYFTIGGHPGFQVPILEHTKQTDYKLLFQHASPLEYLLVYGNTGTADSRKTYQLSLEPMGAYYGCEITEHMFDCDALIFDKGQITWAGIGYPDGTPYITMDCEGFTNFGIWSIPGAPYVCLEPWMGRCDDFGFKEEISQKPDVLTLNPEKTFQKAYTITIHKKCQK